MGIRPQKGFTGLTETLQVHLMAYAVSGFGVIHPVFGSKGPEIGVVVGILEAHLDGLMINVDDGELGLHPGNPHGLKLHSSHGARGVLVEGLIYLNGYLATGNQFTLYQMFFEYLLDNVKSHDLPP